MLHVPPESNEFEGEIMPCSDFRHIPILRLRDQAFDISQRLVSRLTDLRFQKLLVNDKDEISLFKDDNDEHSLNGGHRQIIVRKVVLNDGEGDDERGKVVVKAGKGYGER
nr:hypothetical protein [Tanacetum cinerariifolium]